MMGWGIAVVLLIERGVPWYGAAAIAIFGPFLEMIGAACYDGIKRGRAETKREVGAGR